LLVLPLPDLSNGGARMALRPGSVIASGLMTGPGSAVRWAISDYFYRRAVEARASGDWDAALPAHLAALRWAPSRAGNWIGLGDTARMALDRSSKRPWDWVQYGQLCLYRAKRLQPAAAPYYCEARLLALAVVKGRRDFMSDATEDFEQAIALAPAVDGLRREYARLRSMGTAASAPSATLTEASSGRARP
jgi:hypothetical protein